VPGAPESHDDEAAFVARLKARDETAFNELIELYERRVFALVFRMLGRREEAQEVTQDAFFNVFRHIDGFRGESKLSTWLFHIAVNITKNRLKSDARRHVGQHQDVDAMADHSRLDGASGVSVAGIDRPDEVLEGVRLEVVVKAALERLEPEFRQLVVLCDVEDLSYEEIAEVTKLPRGTVKSRIHRGRQKLKELVERALGEKLGVGKKERQ
jgi:RNA polymerase sigma-70 factor, ECF subfamily